MKAILWLGVISVMTTGALSQGVRPMAQGGLHQPPPSAPLRPHPSHPFAPPVSPLGFGGHGFRGYGFGGYGLGGYGFGGYGFGGYDYGNVPPAQNVVVVSPPPPAYAIAPERPPETATMVIHEYQPVPGALTQALEGDQPTFAIVLKDSTTLSASAVIVQNDALHIVDQDGAHQRVSLDRIDREATKRVNRERKLQLQLPPGR